MLPKQIQEKGILARIFEKGIEILLKKECQNIGKFEIDIVASSIEIIKGKVKKIEIIASDVTYKDLIFDKIELESNNIKVILKVTNNTLDFKNNFMIDFKISLSEKSLRKVLLSNNWNWIGNMISKEMLNQEKLEDLQIRNDKLLITASENNRNSSVLEEVYIKKENGKLYLENKDFNKSIKIPIEDKVCIKDINIKNNIINIFANSSISF